MSTFEPVIVRTIRLDDPRHSTRWRRWSPRGHAALPTTPGISMGRLADSPFRSSTARATCSVALPAPSLSSSLTARRSSLCDARPLTSPASSSARSVRTHPPTTSERRKGQTTMRAIGGYGVRRMASRRCALWLLFGEALSGQLLNWKTATDSDTVKYSAFLRKQTRYNPTRGGTYPHLSIAHKPLPGSAITSGLR
jgi:hypothetical protein